MDPLVREAEKFRKSSAYRHGDRTSFSVPLTSTIKLPGKTDPAHYLDTLGLKTIPKRVLVAGAANGGLVAECFNRGATDVVALEARDKFQNPLQRVIALLAKARPEIGKSQYVRYVGMYPTTPHQQEALGQFDLVLWADGVNEISTPRLILSGMAKCVAPEGTLIMETRHGRHGFVDKINTWAPNSGGMSKAAHECFGGPWFRQAPGRDQTCVVYFFQTKNVEAPKPKKAAPKKAAPKKAPVVKSDDTDVATDEDVAYFQKKLQGALKIPEDHLTKGPSTLTKEDVEEAKEIYREARPMPEDPPVKPALGEGESAEVAPVEENSAPKTTKKKTKKKRKKRKTKAKPT